MELQARILSAEFNRAMDFTATTEFTDQPQFVNEESSFYGASSMITMTPMTPSTHTNDDYYNPQSAGSASLTSEYGPAHYRVPYSEYSAGPVQEQASTVPCFLQLLEEDSNNSKSVVEIQQPEVDAQDRTYTDLSCNSNHEYLRTTINIRQQPSVPVPSTTAPLACYELPQGTLGCAADDTIPIPSFENGIQPCSDWNDLDLVMETITNDDLDPMGGGTETCSTQKTVTHQQSAPTALQPLSSRSHCQENIRVKEEPKTPLVGPYSPTFSCTSPTSTSTTTTTGPSAQRSCRRTGRRDSAPYPMPKQSAPHTASQARNVRQAVDYSKLNPDEIRKERRKASNRKAAKKCREKKLQEQHEIVQAKENTVADLEAARKEIEELRRIIEQCPNHCNCRLPPSTFPPSPPDEPR